MSVALSQNFLVSATLLRDKVPSFNQYPFSIPAIRDLHELRFETPVTFLVGENGSGKSTLLEALAIGCGLNPEGGSQNFTFSTYASHSGLKDYLRLARSARRVRNRYFLRAEAYYNLASNIEELDRGPGGTRIIESYGGKSLHQQSHGESFFALFANRLSGDGLYLFDEPEAALSPSRQLAFLARLHQLVTENAQFIIATHSPILMAYPNAAIYMLGNGAVQKVNYEDTEHFNITKQFLNKPEKMMAELFGQENDL